MPVERSPRTRARASTPWKITDKTKQCRPTLIGAVARQIYLKLSSAANGTQPRTEVEINVRELYDAVVQDARLYKHDLPKATESNIANYLSALNLNEMIVLARRGADPTEEDLAQGPPTFRVTQAFLDALANADELFRQYTPLNHLASLGRRPLYNIQCEVLRRTFNTYFNMTRKEARVNIQQYHLQQGYLDKISELEGIIQSFQSAGWVLTRGLKVVFAFYKKGLETIIQLRQEKRGLENRVAQLERELEEAKNEAKATISRSEALIQSGVASEVPQDAIDAGPSNYPGALVEPATPHLRGRTLGREGSGLLTPDTSPRLPRLRRQQQQQQAPTPETPGMGRGADASDDEDMDVGAHNDDEDDVIFHDGRSRQGSSALFSFNAGEDTDVQMEAMPEMVSTMPPSSSPTRTSLLPPASFLGRRGSTRTVGSMPTPDSTMDTDEDDQEEQEVGAGIFTDLDSPVVDRSGSLAASLPHTAAAIAPELVAPPCNACPAKDVQLEQMVQDIGFVLETLQPRLDQSDDARTIYEYVLDSGRYRSLPDYDQYEDAWTEAVELALEREKRRANKRFGRQGANANAGASGSG